jgi:chromate transporter
VLIVTLIGYTVGGFAGAFAATVAMCLPTAVLAYVVSHLLKGSKGARWPSLIRTSLVPLSIGLMGASALVVSQAADGTWPAVVLTLAAAALAFATKVNPLWILLAGGCLGLVGVV